VPRESIDALKQQWQRLVVDHFETRRDAQRLGHSDEVLRQLDLVYGVKIDLAYAELKIAESLEVLRVTVQRSSGVLGATS
jgi:hypothetical protein